MEHEDIITTATAAVVLKVVPNHVRHLARTGVLPIAITTPSGQRLFSLAVVEALRDQRAARQHGR